MQKDGVRTAKDAQPLMDAVLDRTGLPIDLDGIYRWVAFLPSQMDARVPVANRYFGVFQSGEAKVRDNRGPAHDTPRFHQGAAIGYDRSDGENRTCRIYHPVYPKWFACCKIKY